LKSGVTWSRRGYHGTRWIENSPLASISRESEEELARFSPRSAIWLIREHFPLILPLSTQPPTSPISNPSTPTPTPPPTPPPPKVGMMSAIKLPIFKGVGVEEPGRFWFVIRSVWDTQGIVDENIKKATLGSALHDRLLTWYIKYSTDHLNEGIATIQDALNKEFGQPKSETQLVNGFKEITMLHGETSWDLE